MNTPADEIYFLWIAAEFTGDGCMPYAIRHTNLLMHMNIVRHLMVQKCELNFIECLTP